jgi:hypothetical protein
MDALRNKNERRSGVTFFGATMTIHNISQTKQYGILLSIMLLSTGNLYRILFLSATPDITHSYEKNLAAEGKEIFSFPRRVRRKNFTTSCPQNRA